MAQIVHSRGGAFSVMRPQELSRLLLVAIFLLLPACGQSRRPAAGSGNAPSAVTNPTGATAMAIHVSSPDFGDGQPIPVVHTGDGADRSPRLVIGEVPEAARSLALICDDPDAPTPQPWVHWIVYDLSPGIGQLPGGLPRNSRLCELGGAAQGKNSWGTLGYRGPAPPRGHGRHRYRFTVYALDLPPGLPDGLDKQALLESISAHVLASGQWQGTYQR